MYVSCTIIGLHLVKLSALQSIFTPPSLVVFKWDGLHWRAMNQEEAVSQLKIQEYLDDVSGLDIPHSYSQWYNVDVASLLNGTRIEGHELDPKSGSSLIFLKSSAMLCCPSSGRIHHYPKNLMHCFVDDNRGKSNDSEGILMRAELFSISPKEEQLCWECNCRSELEIPEVQSRVSRWLSWLNS